MPAMTPPLSRRRLLAAFAALPLVAAVPGAGWAADAEKVTVALDWYPNADHAGLFLAQQRGYFANEGLQVDLYTPSDPTTVLQTVGAGKDTFGISYQTDVLLARAQGVPVVSVAALVQHPLLAVMAKKEAAITRPRDLVGKTVGYPGIPSQEAFLATMLETDGAKLADVTLVNVSFNLVPALISGQVAAVMGAYWTHETILAEREGYPVDILRVEEWGVPDYYELVLVASEETVADRADLVTAFLRAIQHGYDDAIADQAAALDALASAYEAIDRDVESEGLRLLVPVWTDGITAFGEQTPARWDTYGAWMKQRGLIPADLDVARAYTTTLLPMPQATPTA
ncbi:MAG TPA: ABC transporter substrate-binding protein [Thermomicrobiales bacterium]|jgi:putative hydroxymethylpyrimidine transport system substrate-binding protein